MHSYYTEQYLSDPSIAKNIQFYFENNIADTGLQVGYEDTCVKAQRKSGKNAWSERTHGVLIEESFETLAARWGDNIPFHRIKFFKDNGVVVWCDTRALCRNSDCNIADISVRSPRCFRWLLHHCLLLTQMIHKHHIPKHVGYAA